MDGKDETIARFGEMIVRAQEAIDSLKADSMTVEDRTGMEGRQSLQDETIEQYLQIIASAKRIVGYLQARPASASRLLKK